MLLVHFICTLFMVIEITAGDNIIKYHIIICWHLSSAKTPHGLDFQNRNQIMIILIKRSINTVKLSLCRDKKHFHGSVQLYGTNVAFEITLASCCLLFGNICWPLHIFCGLQARGWRSERWSLRWAFNSVSQQMHGWCSERILLRESISSPIILCRNNQYSLASLPVVW